MICAGKFFKWADVLQPTSPSRGESSGLLFLRSTNVTPKDPFLAISLNRFESQQLAESGQATEHKP